jgi:hypothetical protein
MAEDRTQTPPLEKKMVEFSTTENKNLKFSENRGLDHVVVMAPVVVPEPVAPAPTSSGSAGDGAQATGGGTAPADFDG